MTSSCIGCCLPRQIDVFRTKGRGSHQKSRRWRLSDMMTGRLLQTITPQQGKGDTITLAHPEGPYMQIHRKLRHEPNQFRRIRRVGRRCGTSQPTPTPLTCKVVVDYTCLGGLAPSDPSSGLGGLPLSPHDFHDFRQHGPRMRVDDLLASSGEFVVVLLRSPLRHFARSQLGPSCQHMYQRLSRRFCVRSPCCASARFN